jgi:FkbM family methyltransferase
MKLDAIIVINRLKELILQKFNRNNLFSNSIMVIIENSVARLCGLRVRFSYNPNDNIFFASEDLKQIKFSNRIRGFSLYRNGIKKRAEFIFDSYCLKNIVFSEDDVVIDCGANSGDLMIKLKEFIKLSNYIGIEPNPSDFEILKLNVSNESKLINKGLGNSNQSLPFYVCTEDGDSSFIEPKKYSQICDISVLRLDNLMQQLNLNKVKLIKIEAEGYEPEILEGLGSSIDKCQYIAIDGGYERGKNCEQTFTKLTNHLLNNGFEIIDIYFPLYRALFSKKVN